MNKEFILKNYIIIFSIFILLSFMAAPLYSQMKVIIEQEDKENNHSDSLQVYPAKLGSYQLWENIVNIPGDILYFPFWIILTGIEETAEFIDESRIVPRMRNLLLRNIRPLWLSPNYSPRHGAGFKIGYYKNFDEKAKVDFTLTRGLLGRQMYRLRFRQLQFFDDAVSTDITIQHILLSDERFFGIGNNTSYSDESNFALRQSTIEALVTAKLTERAGFKFRLGLDINDVNDRKNNTIPSTVFLFTEESVPGLQQESRIFRMQLGILHDSRNRLVRTNYGGILSFNGGIFKDFKNDAFNFWKVSANFSRYIHLFYNRTLLFRFAGEVTEPFSGKNIPFYYLSKLGEQETIRGFTRGRFHDLDMVLGSLEYHYPIWRLIDAEFFIDVGQVSENIFEQFSRNDFHTGFGGSLSLLGKDNIIAQFTIGRSKERIRFYFSVNKNL